MLALVLATWPCVCVQSVCLYVTSRCSIETDGRIDLVFGEEGGFFLFVGVRFFEPQCRMGWVSKFTYTTCRVGSHMAGRVEPDREKIDPCVVSCGSVGGVYRVGQKIFEIFKKIFKNSECLAKLQARTWLFRAPFPSFSIVLAKRTSARDSRVLACNFGRYSPILKFLHSQTQQ